MPKKLPNKKTKNKKELAIEYGVSVSTFNKWLRDLNGEFPKIENCTIFTPKQLKFIYEEFGNPADK